MWPCSSIRPICDCRDHVERCASGCSRHGVANPGPQRQHQPRDRCGLRNICARAARCPLRRRRSLFQQPACPVGPSWRRAMRSPRHMRSRDFPEIGGLISYGASITDRVVRPASTPAVSSRVPSLRTCRSCRRASSSGHQRPDRQDARPRSAADPARPRRRGDRIEPECLSH